MGTRRCLWAAGIICAASLLTIACGDDDERETPDCNVSDCIEEADGGTPLNANSTPDESESAR